MPESSLHGYMLWDSWACSMNWSKESPIEGVKYIVRTDTQKLFPAFWENGGWWHSEGAFEILNVCTWIVYPERYSKCEDRNPEVPTEVLLKYAVRDYIKMKEIAGGESEKVSELKKLNKSLVSEYNALLMAHKELKKKFGQNAFVPEAEQEKTMDKLDVMENERTNKLKEKLEHLRQELIQVRKEARKGRTLHGNLQKLLERFSLLDDVQNGG